MGVALRVIFALCNVEIVSHVVSRRRTNPLAIGGPIHAVDKGCVFVRSGPKRVFVGVIDSVNVNLIIVRANS